ncbi:hypothetical protein LTR10_007464 [Elasticomyces elasticus]|nr:hypothetical protein LTR10_007464 [Elasticomyces elasticus]KAK4979272.1 hypothetical protein LTR42_001775 [Elasticomyces elasticus]
MFGKLQGPRYHRIDTLEQDNDKPSQRPVRALITLLFGAVTFTIGLIVGRLGTADHAVVEAWKTLHAASPLIGGIDFQLNIRKLDNRLTGQEYALSQGPSTENDAVWEHLHGPLFVRISEEELIQTGTAPEVALRLPSSDDYVAKLDISHELHCLGAIRKSVYREHYFQNATADRLAWDHQHVHHCLQVILNSLICGATTDLTPFTWYGDSDEPNDFVLKRQCINLDNVIQWGRDRALPEEFNPFAIGKPQGQKTLAARIEDELTPRLIEDDILVR